MPSASNNTSASGEHACQMRAPTGDENRGVTEASNQKCGDLVVNTVELMVAVLATLPKSGFIDSELSGMEVMAIYIYGQIYIRGYMGFRLTETGVAMLGKGGSDERLWKERRIWVTVSLFAERSACTMRLIGAVCSSAISSCRHGCDWQAALGVLAQTPCS